jgi:beta-glucosidase
MTALLKYPLHECTLQILGKCIPYVPQGATSLGNLYRTITAVAKAAICTTLIIPSIPLWMLGEAIEYLWPGSNKAFDDTVALSQNIDPAAKPTDMTGFPISTYQYKSRQDFCHNSDWGRYYQKHFDKSEGIYRSEILDPKALTAIIQKIKNSGCSTLRISIKPEEVTNLEGYQRAIEKIKQEGLSLEVVLHHSTFAIDDLESYVATAREVIFTLQDLADSFVVFNEPLTNPDRVERSAYQRILNIFPISLESKLNIIEGVDPLTEAGLTRLIEETKARGGNTLRFSIEWDNVRKADGSFDIGAALQYVAVAQTIKEAGLNPMVVFHHFVTPVDQEGKSLFESMGGSDEFVDFVQSMHSYLKDHVTDFMIFNEPKVNTVMNYVTGEFPAEQVMRFWKEARVFKNMCSAYEKIYDHIKQNQPNARVGLTQSVNPMMAQYRSQYLCRAIAFVINYIFHDSFMHWAVPNKDKIDLLGIQYYARPLMGGYFVPDTIARPDQKMAKQMRYRVDPEGLLPTLRALNVAFKGTVRMFVSETGTPATGEDEVKLEYAQKSWHAFKQAQEEGVNVIGWMPWAPFRNREWAYGYRSEFNFGLSQAAKSYLASIWTKLPSTLQRAA